MIQFPDLDWLLFDLDNTIVDFNASSKEAFVKLLEELGVEKPADLYPKYNVINHKCWDEREAGLISHTELKKKRWDLFFKEVGIDYDPLSANDFYFEVIKTNPILIEGAETLLQKIQGKYRTMIITNGLSEVQNPRIKKLKLEQYFEQIIISDEIGVAKPQQKFFDHCENLMPQGVNRDRVLVIGDTLKSDIKGGNAYGYQTCWYNYYKKENDTDIQPGFVVDNLATLGTALGV